MLTIIKGVKVGMTSVFDGTGTTLPVTLIRPLKMVVTQKKTREKDGYTALQLAYDETTAKHVNNPSKGVLKKAGVKGYYRRFFEAKVDETLVDSYELGQVIDPADFLDHWGEVDVWGFSKGKGFAGAMKRHGFKGQERTHGEPDERRPMSSGATDPARVFPGTKKPGHMGARRTTVYDISCFEFNSELNLLAVQGSVPGANGSVVTLKLRKKLAEEEVDEIRKEREGAKSMSSTVEEILPESLSTEASFSEPASTVKAEETAPESSREPSEKVQSQPVLSSPEAVSTESRTDTLEQDQSSFDPSDTRGDPDAVSRDEVPGASSATSTPIEEGESKG